jgi:hypothetical protein
MRIRVTPWTPMSREVNVANGLSVVSELSLLGASLRFLRFSHLC